MEKRHMKFVLFLVPESETGLQTCCFVAYLTWAKFCVGPVVPDISERTDHPPSFYVPESESDHAAQGQGKYYEIRF